MMSRRKRRMKGVKGLWIKGIGALWVRVFNA